MTRWCVLAALVFAGTLALGTDPAEAVVPARSLKDPPPRITAQVTGAAPRPLGTVGLLPLGDAPRAPGTGPALEAALCAGFSQRDAACTPLAPPADASGKPLPGVTVPGSRLAEAGRAAGVAVVVTGRVVSFDVEADWLPGLTVWRPGVLVEVPPGGVIRTNLAFQLRAVSADTGRPLCSVQVRHGPVARLPEQALGAAVGAALDRCFGAPP